MENYAKNPQTGRLIKVDGSTYLKLKDKMNLGELKVVRKGAFKARLTV